MKAQPLAIAAVPRVAISEGTLTMVTRMPLPRPPAAPVASPASAASGQSTP